MVTAFTYRPSLVKIDARNFELSWKQTHKQITPARCKQTGPITIYCTANLSVQCNRLNKPTAARTSILKDLSLSFDTYVTYVLDFAFAFDTN